LRVQGEIPHLHVFCHALSKGSHGELLYEWNCCTAASPSFRSEISQKSAKVAGYGFEGHAA
jgi:hypothetical protein